MTSEALPNGWVATTLGDLGALRGGLTPSKANPRFWQHGTVPWVSPKDMKSFLISAAEDHITEAALAETNLALFPSSSVLMVVRSGILARTFPVSVNTTPVTINQDLKALVPPGQVHPRFLAHQLRSRERQILHQCVKDGTTVTSIDVTSLEQWPLQLPPGNEQSRIVSKIEELFSDLDAGVAALERARANLKRYRAAVLKAAVEGRLTAEWRKAHPDVEPASKLLERILAERRRKWEEAQLAKFTAADKPLPKGWKEKYPEPAKPATTSLPDLPAGWCWATIDQLAALVRNGLPEKPASEPPGFPILRINAVRPMSVDLAEVRYLNREREQVSDYFLEDGDLLFTRYNGSIELLGVSGMVRNCNQATLHPDKLIRVKAVLENPLPAFVELASNVGQSRKHIQAKARTTAGQTGVSGTDIKETPVPLCAPEEQQQIIDEVDTRLSALSKADAEIEAGIKRAARLRQSILKRAFEGKLVPQDPNDEPASVLLERIRAARAATVPAPRIGKRSNPARGRAQ